MIGTLRKFVTGKRVVPSVPPNREVSTPEGEPDAVIRRRDGTSGLGLFIEYMDANGQHSMRRIACKYFDPGHRVIQAWCFERGAPRQFRLDRIVSAACTETGELFDVKELLDILARRGLPSKDARFPRVLNVLVFLMRCDGVHHSEVNVLEDAVTSYALRFGGDDALVIEGMRLINTLAPDSTDFLRTFSWMKTRRDKAEMASFLRRHAASVIDADGVHSDDEVRFGLELGDHLTRLARA